MNTHEFHVSFVNIGFFLCGLHYKDLGGLLHVISVHERFVLAADYAKEEFFLQKFAKIQNFLV